MVFGIVMGIWFVAVGAYSFYYAFMMKQTGAVKTGWIVSKDIQLKESRNMPAFIEIAVKKTYIFACVATFGGLLFLIGVIANMLILMLVCILVLMGTFIWYSSVIRSAEKQYLVPSLKTKNKKKKK